MKSLSDHIKQSLDRSIPIPQDYSRYSATEIAETIYSNVLVDMIKTNAKPNDYYAGICKDVEDNMYRHKNDSYVALIECGSREKSGEVEIKLDKFGLDVGEKPNNGGDDETTIVYVIHKNEDFEY